MKKIQLYKRGKRIGRFAMVDDDNFELINTIRWGIREHHGNFYSYQCIGNGAQKTTISMHRLILCLRDPKIQVDHIDGNGLNNQIVNLRVVSNSQNQWNRRPNKNCSSIYKGVFFCNKDSPNNWRSSIMCNKKRIHLGVFNTQSGAASAYNEAAKEHHGVFAKLNNLSLSLFQ